MEWLQYLLKIKDKKAINNLYECHEHFENNNKIINSCSIINGPAILLLEYILYIYIY